MSKIAVDAHGGDNAPLEILKGAILAKNKLGIGVTLVGIPDIVEQCAKENNLNISGFEIVPAKSAMPVEEEPTKLLKEYADSSMGVCMSLLKNGSVAALVSAGSTGALTVGATLAVGRIKGIKRVAIAVLIPNLTGKYMLLDSGANAECRPDMLRQFAIMGKICMEKVYNIPSPKIGLVNIGSEKGKGTPLQLDTDELLSVMPTLNYVGNVEARDLSFGCCDVAVCDGFTGNIILKTSEGVAKLLSTKLKTMFMSSLSTKLSALLVKNALRDFKASFDYKEYGGAMLLGAKAPVIKAHGSSDAVAIMNAIRQANECIRADVIKTLEDSILKCEV